MQASVAASLVVTIALLTSRSVIAGDSADSTLVTTMTSEAIELTVPVSALKLTIPRGNLVPIDEPRIGAQASPRYFYFEDKDRGLMVSGWFESAASFGGFEKFWLNEFSAMKQSGLVPMAAPTSVVVGPWLGASYDIEVPSSIGEGSNTHIRAHLIKAGTWIDLHISITTLKSLADARREALELLKSIVVTEK